MSIVMGDGVGDEGIITLSVYAVCGMRMQNDDGNEGSGIVG